MYDRQTFHFPSAALDLQPLDALWLLGSMLVAAGLQVAVGGIPPKEQWLVWSTPALACGGRLSAGPAALCPAFAGSTVRSGIGWRECSRCGSSAAQLGAGAVLCLDDPAGVCLFLGKFSAVFTGCAFGCGSGVIVTGFVLDDAGNGAALGGCTGAALACRAGIWLGANCCAQLC